MRKLGRRYNIFSRVISIVSIRWTACGSASALRYFNHVEFQFIRTILEALMYMVRNDEGEKPQYGLNLFVRVNFTGGNRSAKILGTGSLNPTESTERRLIAHITFAHLARPCSSEDWCDLATRLTNFQFKFSPRSTLHWKSEWHTLQVRLLLLMKNGSRR